MSDNDRPIPRDDLVFDVEQGLRKARTLWPRKRIPGDTGAYRRVADAVVAHLELCRVRCFRRPPAALHSTPVSGNRGHADEATEREDRDGPGSAARDAP